MTVLAGGIALIIAFVVIRLAQGRQIVRKMEATYGADMARHMASRPKDPRHRTMAEEVGVSPAFSALALLLWPMLVVGVILTIAGIAGR